MLQSRWYHGETEAMETVWRTSRRVTNLREEPELTLKSEASSIPSCLTATSRGTCNYPSLPVEETGSEGQDLVQGHRQGQCRVLFQY